jgi:prevent-host-death family protein
MVLGGHVDRTVSATEARVHFGETLRRVVENHETVLVERAGTPVAAIIPLAEYERLVADRDQRAWREALARAAQARGRVEAELEGRALPAPEEILRRVREDRDGELVGLR